MIQDIKFQGLSNSPSDNSVQDGELGSCLNLIPEDGELKPIQQPVMVDGGDFLSEGMTIEYIHKVSYDSEIKSHYICYDDLNDGWYWHLLSEPNNVFHEIPLPAADEFHVNSVTSIGNILCFVGSGETMYAFWDVESNSYNTFDLSSLNYTISIDSEQSYSRFTAEFSDDDFWHIFKWNAIGNTDDGNKKVVGIKATGVDEVLSAIDASMTKSITDLKDKWFKNMVFCVAALRLYDGSYINVSNIFVLPIYKIDNTIWYDADATAAETKAAIKTVRLGSTIHRHNVKVSMDLKNVGALVQGIDIYCTNGEFLFDSSKEYSDRILVGNDENADRRGGFKLDNLNGRELFEKIDGLPFYHSVYISKEEFATGIPMKRPSGAEESMTLADFRRSIYGAGCSFVYNNRLHLANVNETLFQTEFENNPFFELDIEHLGNGYNSNYPYSQIFGKYLDLPIENGNYTTNEQFCEVCCAIKIRSKYIYLHAKAQYPLPPLLTFPNSNIDNVKLFLKYNGYYKKTLSIRQSDTRGCSYYMNTDDDGVFGFMQVNDITGEVSSSGTVLSAKRNSQFEDSSEEEWNSMLALVDNTKIYNSSPSLIKVSEAENPLVFPASNSVQVGSSVIKAMAANTRPITEGQFGDAPLYVFTDEGTWMLMLSTDGVYQARQPVNRDVCSNPDGILQIDDAVLFPTERGIMMQTGSTAKLITDALDGAVFDYMQLYKESYSKKILAVGSIPEAGIKYMPFRQFMKGADMVYDYYDARIIVFNPDCAYAYVYSLKSGLWGAMESNIKKRVNIYPESYAINGDRKIVDFYQSQPVGPTRYFLCTRPMAIGSAEAYKTMFSCITRGYFRNEVGKCGMALYASNDLFKWFPVSTSVNKFLRGMCGSPYKYFRLALIGSLLPEESIGGLSADYQERWQNKLR